MYLELSRPAGDVSRWEKVMKRLTLLNKHYPLTATQCSHINFQRKMADDKKTDEIYDIVQKTLIDQGVVFFGGSSSKFCSMIYSNLINRVILISFILNIIYLSLFLLSLFLLF